MRYYPVFLDLRDKECLVVGAGEVGRRKIKTLAKTKPKKIIVIDPNLDDTFVLNFNELVVFEKRKFKESDLNGKFLVVASTSNKDLNEHIGRLCNKRNILCNVVDNPSLSNFIVPATIDKENIIVAISTEGKSPALTKLLKKEINNIIKDEIIILAEIMGRLRPFIKQQGKNNIDNKNIFNSLINKDIIHKISVRDRNTLINLIKDLTGLDEKIIGDVLDDIL